ncbi:uncharacterized protein LOC110047052 isoform X2 [Orbicella faveolata]|uniref:uncharacterized protein LOC110047052 isoform X2 n=1 Tax=Orbicella faveolata TaxID=48498 RepID=UPI0009E30D1A|nr:uncharacterized protein LOC110047052 isoform X2 [Orbicella faveolata]
MLKSSALSMMAKANNELFLSVVVVLISFAFGEGSFVTYNTQVGCNATLVCNQPGNVTWIYTATSENVEGQTKYIQPYREHIAGQLWVRFRSQTHAFFSTLSIIDVSKSDNKNITCVAEGHNLTINVAGQCKTTIDPDVSGKVCDDPYMVEHCKKSCGFCPEPNCTEAVLPTLPPTTANPQTTKNDTQPTTESRSTVSSSTKDVVKDEPDGNSGVALGSGLHNDFVLASILLAMTISEFLND